MYVDAIDPRVAHGRRNTIVSHTNTNPLLFARHGILSAVLFACSAAVVSAANTAATPLMSAVEAIATSDHSTPSTTYGVSNFREILYVVAF